MSETEPMTAEELANTRKRCEQECGGAFGGVGPATAMRLFATIADRDAKLAQANSELGVLWAEYAYAETERRRLDGFVCRRFDATTSDHTDAYEIKTHLSRQEWRHMRGQDRPGLLEEIVSMHLRKIDAEIHHANPTAAIENARNAVHGKERA